MPWIDLNLNRRNLSIRADDSGESKILHFEAKFEGREQLENDKGIVAESGYIEFTRSNPRFEAAQLHFVDTYFDPDTNEEIPASISFYADLSIESFDQIVSLVQCQEVNLRIRTKDLVGPIKYGNDPDGYIKIWDTEKENPVIPEEYEISISSN